MRERLILPLFEFVNEPGLWILDDEELFTTLLLRFGQPPKNIKLEIYSWRREVFDALRAYISPGRVPASDWPQYVEAKLMVYLDWLDQLYR